MTAHHYSMKWDNYHSHVGDIFSQLLETGSMADVILYAEGEKINCHKMLLSACSPYFQEILTTAGANNTIVVVSGISGEDVRSIIEFVYRGEISVKADRFASVLKAAEALKICGLMEVSSHLSEMEVSEIGISTSSNQNNDKQYNKKKDDLNETIGKKNFVRIREKNNEAQPGKTVPIVSPDDVSSWGCIQWHQPSQNSTSITRNDKDVNEMENNSDDYTKETNANDCLIVDDSGKINSDIDVTTELIRNDDNVGQNKEDLFKFQIKSTDFHMVQTCSKQESNINSEEELSCDDLKSKRRKDMRKKLYSEEAMLAALEDMKAGKNLVKSAAKHHVPRTTLYMRARAIGACPAMVRKGYPSEKVTAALESVAGGSSLQCAATEFGIPKTVLWRRVQKEIGNTTMHCKRIKNSPATNQVNSKEALLHDGVSIRRVSPQYQIPKATLFRWEKVQLTNDSKLVKTIPEDQTDKPEITHQVRLKPNIMSKNGKQEISPQFSSSTDKYNKITKQPSVWASNVQHTDDSRLNAAQHSVRFIKTEDAVAVAVEQLKRQPQEEQPQSDFNFSEGVHELPVSYVNTQFSDSSSIIILAPVDNNKYTIQRHASEEVSDAADKILNSMEVEDSASQNDAEKSN